MKTSTIHNKIYSGAATVVMALTLAAGSSCGDDVQLGDLDPLALQSVKRFPIGSTFFLPSPDSGRWVLDRGPADNANDVVGRRRLLSLHPAGRRRLRIPRRRYE